MKGKSHRKSQENTLAEVTCSGDSRLAADGARVNTVQKLACPLLYILVSVTRPAHTIGKHSSKKTEP